MAWPVRNWATSSFPFQEKASNNRILEAFTWFCVLLNTNQPQLKRFSLISTTGHVIHTRNTNLYIACIHFQCHSMLFPFLKYDIGQVSPYWYSKNVKRSSTALKIKDILLKLAFQTHSKVHSVSSAHFANMSSPPLLCRQLSRIQPLPHFTLFCLPSNVCVLPPPWWTLSLPSMDSKPTLTPALFIGPRPPRTGSQMRIIQSGGLDAHRHHDQSTKTVLPGRHPDTYGRQWKGSLWRSKSWRQSYLELLRIQSSNYSFPARNLLLTSIKKLPSCPSHTHPTWAASFCLTGNHTTLKCSSGSLVIKENESKKTKKSFSPPHIHKRPTKPRIRGMWGNDHSDT